MTKAAFSSLRTPPRFTCTRRLLCVISASLLSGCNLAEKLARIGDPPPITRIQDPTLLPNYTPVNMPMPEPHAEHPKRSNSLWQTGSKAFFKDQRASKVGDILTIVIDLNQEQKIEMTPKLDQSSALSAGISHLYGLKSKTYNIVPRGAAGGADNANLLGMQSNPSMSGSGSYSVKDKIKFNIAATVIQMLPNGSMVVEGRQELGLVNEVRDIHIKGIVRREDISSSNMIGTDKIAQLRISYHGRGDLTDNMSEPLGHQAIKQLSPF